MVRWIKSSCQRSIRIRRTILLSVVIFMITTSCLYAFIEHDNMKDPFISSSTSLQVTCQLKNETLRAIHLASTNSCKEFLKEIACEIDSKKDFFPLTLPRFCPMQSRKIFKKDFRKFY